MARPRGGETRRKTEVFRDAFRRTRSAKLAARESGLDPGRVLGLLDEPEYRALAVGLLSGDVVREAA